MSFALINRSPDLCRLRDEGYEVQIKENFLLISGVPYVSSERKVERGILVSELTLSGDKTARPSHHVVYFVGTRPCNLDGSSIAGIQHGDATQQLAEGIVVNRSFSNKPPEGYADYYEKVTRYVTIVSDPARAIDATATARTFKPLESQGDGAPFVYIDTNSSRAHIGRISAKLNGQRIGIIGVGGTGSYVLDMIAKTPVAEIHLFDGDQFLQHNAFRSPGAAPLEELKNLPLKVDYFAKIYSAIHKGIVAHPIRVSRETTSQLESLTFVFLCVDANEHKRHIVEYLIAREIPFVDSGIGIEVADDALVGIVRTTTVTKGKNDHAGAKIACDGAQDDAYSTNIQIAELNMLNAAMAVIKWKKLEGFYVDIEKEHHSTFTISGNLLLNDETCS